MIGSHNSMTYLRPQKWWQRLIGFTSKCQEKDILKQYKAGVRVFDIRVNIDKLCYAHGLVDYKTNYSPPLFYTPLVNELEGVYYRIILEKGDKKKFKQYINFWLSKMPTTRILYIVDDKKNWNIIWINKRLSFREYNYHPEYPSYGLIPNPKKHNKDFPKLTEEHLKDNNTIYWIDFV